MSNLSNSLMVAFCLERPERFAQGRSFVLSDLSKLLTVAPLNWAKWANERIPSPGYFPMAKWQTKGLILFVKVNKIVQIWIGNYCHLFTVFCMSLKFRDYLPLKKSNWYIKVLLPLIYKSACSSIGTALKLCLNHGAWHSNIVKYLSKISR